MKKKTIKHLEKKLERAKNKLEQILETWEELPEYVFEAKYEFALMAWVQKQITQGRKNIENLITFALHQELRGQEPFFAFNRN